MSFSVTLLHPLMLVQDLVEEVKDLKVHMQSLESRVESLATGRSIRSTGHVIAELEVWLQHRPI
jgi:hypothetical protein